MKRWSGFRIFSAIVLALCAYIITAQVMSRGQAITPTAAQRKESGRVLAVDGTHDDRELPPGAPAVAGPGIVEPRTRETKLAAASAGLITWINVSEGQKVERGRLVAQLETAAERAALASAEEEVVSAKLDLSKVQAGERRETVLAAEADMRSLRAKADQSAEVMQRLEGLAAKDLVTRDEFARARRTADQDRAAAEASKSRYDALANGSRAEDIAIAAAKVAQSERKLAERRAALALREIRAPAAGTVLQVKYRAGEYFTPGGEPLMLIGDISARRARIDVDERDIAHVHLGDAAYVTAPAYRDRRFAARVAEIGQRIGRKNIRTDDPKERIDTKILEVVLEIEGGAELLPGLRVTGVIGGGPAR